MSSSPDAPTPSKGGQANRPSKKLRLEESASEEYASDQFDQTYSTTDKLKDGVSNFLRRTQNAIADHAPELADKAERAAHVAIEKTARGLDQFERGANDVEGRAREKIRGMLDKARSKI